MLAVRRWSPAAVSALLLLGAPYANSRANAALRVPVVVELFTSEGCSSCPPADTLLQRLVDSQPAAGVEVIGLGEHVDYWDHQGWRDRFSSAALTSRQQVYGARFNTDSIYTPQMVVDGRTEFVGSDAEAARRALVRASAIPHGRLDVSVHAGRAGEEGGPEGSDLQVTVTVSDVPTLARGDHADLVVAVTEDGLQSDVSRGENRGRLLKHAAVVRELKVAGELPPNGSITAGVPIDRSWRADRLKLIAFVQERRGRAILAAAAIPVPSR